MKHDDTELHLEDEAGNPVIARVFIAGGDDPFLPQGRYVQDLTSYAYCATKDNRTGMAYSEALQREAWQGLPFGGINIEQPLVDPVLWRELYRRDPVNHACCDAKVEYIVGQGYRLRPKQELFGGDMPASQLDKQPDEAQRQVALNFLEASQPDYSFLEMAVKLELDLQSTGNAFMELVRDADGTLVRLGHLPSETMRIELNYQGFMQARDTRYRFWSRYGSGYQSVSAENMTLKAAAKAGYDISGIDHKHRYLAFQKQSVSDLADYLSVDPDDFVQIIGQAKGEPNVATSVNDMMHFKQETPRDTNYGEPAIAAAIEDHLGAKNQRQFMAMYFDRGMIARLAFVVKGRLSDAVVKTIETWAKGSARLEAANSVLVIELPPETEMDVEKLSSEALNEGAFMAYRQMCDGAIKMAHRVPDSIVQTAANSNRAESAESNAKFITGVVRPTQVKRAEKYNLLLERELGVTDWVVDFNIPDLESEQVKAQVTKILMDQGVLSINEVRRVYNHAPIPGGDVPMLKLGGGHVMLVEKGAQLMKIENAGGKGQDAADALPDVPKGAMLLPGEKHCTLLLPIPLAGLTEEQRGQMAGIVKDIGVWNEDDIGSVFGLTEQK
jgi:capsid portal protein